MTLVRNVGPHTCVCTSWENTSSFIALYIFFFLWKNSNLRWTDSPTVNRLFSYFRSFKWCPNILLWMWCLFKFKFHICNRLACLGQGWENKLAFSPLQTSATPHAENSVSSFIYGKATHRLWSVPLPFPVIVPNSFSELLLHLNLTFCVHV